MRRLTTPLRLIGGELEMAAELLFQIRRRGGRAQQRAGRSGDSTRAGDAW